MFVYIFSRVNPGADKRESSSHVQEQCNILLCRLKQCMHLELRAVLFNTCSVKKKEAYCASHVKKSLNVFDYRAYARDGGKWDENGSRFPFFLLFASYLIFSSASLPSFRHPSIRLTSSARAANSSTEQERERGDRGRRKVCDKKQQFI